MLDKDSAYEKVVRSEAFIGKFVIPMLHVIKFYLLVYSLVSSRNVYTPQIKKEILLIGESSTGKFVISVLYANYIFWCILLFQKRLHVPN